MKAQSLHKPAKNVIFMMGDGMGVSTLTAARIYLAQTRNLTWTNASLAWERMPHTALSKVVRTCMSYDSRELCAAATTNRMKNVLQSNDTTGFIIKQ